MARLGYCLGFSSVSDCRWYSYVVVSSTTRSRALEIRNLHFRGSHHNRRPQLLEDVFTDIQSVSCLNSRQKRQKHAMLLNNQYWFVWLDYWVASRDLTRQRSWRRTVPRTLLVGSYMPCDELQYLCKAGQLKRALDILLRVDHQGSVPSVEMYRTILKVCTKRKALAQARQVHAHLVRHGLQSTRYLGESVVKTLVMCGSLEDALQVFNTLLHRSVVSWTAVITGFTTSGEGKEALRMYQLMQEEGVVPDEYTFVSVVKACGNMADLQKGKCIHAEALKYRYHTALFVGTCLVDMYAKCGSILDAQIVFDGLSEQSVVSWTIMLKAYAHQGQPEKALQLYGEMRKYGMTPDKRTFVTVFQACGMLAEKEEHVVVHGRATKAKSLETGKAIHADVQRKGYDSDVFVGHTLISMYGKCQSIADSVHVFDGLADRDVVSWTAIIATYAQQGHIGKVLQLYEQMQEEGVSPNDRTFVSVLQACAILAGKENDSSTKLNILEVVKAVHANACRKGYESDVFVSSTLMSLYGKCGRTLEASILFHRLSLRNLVSWNTVVDAYTQNNQADKALQLYAQMQDEGVSPDSWTFASALQACGILGELEHDVISGGCLSSQAKPLEKGQAIHADIRKKGLDSNVFVGNSLISMYAKCGSIVDARDVFDGLSTRDLVSWNAMLSAYVEQGQGECALLLYREMQEGGLKADQITLVCLFQACANTGSLETCTQIHSSTLLSTSSDLSPVLASTLIHTYSRCASIVDAQKVFDSLSKPDVVSWTTLIAGYARVGNYSSSLQCYNKMQAAGVKPNGVTLLSLICACSHAGLVDKGVEYFESMSRDHGLTPDMEHYVSMVDLLGRAGYFEMVEALLQTMPLQPTLALWLCLLGACRKHKKVVLGKHAFDHAVHLQPKHSAAYLLMSNIYVDAGLWDCLRGVQSLERKAGVWNKPPGQSWMEHEHAVHTFVVGAAHSIQQQEQVHDLLGKIRHELKEHIPHISRQTITNGSLLSSLQWNCTHGWAPADAPTRQLPAASPFS